MTVTLEEAHIHAQRTISDNAVVVIGSGLSAAAGLPTMGQLARLLLESLPIDASLNATWAPVAVELDNGVDLETALNHVAADSPLLDEVIATVGARVLELERDVLAAMAAGAITLPLTVLIRKLAQVNTGRMVVVTTNYDRLAEAAIEHAGLLIDCSFPGSYFSLFDADASRLLFRAPAAKSGHLYTTRQHVAVAKPHGSLDWYGHESGPIRSMVDFDVPRLIITPGSSKYEKGYERPFDYHRECGNTAIKKAKSLVILGYGFNDSHLQQHLEPRLRAGTPALVVTRTLTDNAKAVLAASPEAIAYERTKGVADGTPSTTVHWKGAELTVDADLWDLANLASEVLS